MICVIFDGRERDSGVESELGKRGQDHRADEQEIQGQ